MFDRGGYQLVWLVRSIQQVETLDHVGRHCVSQHLFWMIDTVLNLDRARSYAILSSILWLHQNYIVNDTVFQGRRKTLSGRVSPSH